MENKRTIINLFDNDPIIGDRRYLVCQDTKTILVQEYLGINGYAEVEGGFNRYPDENGWSYLEEGLGLPEEKYLEDFIKTIKEIYNARY